jgi:hypothetical protein
MQSICKVVLLIHFVMLSNEWFTFVVRHLKDTFNCCDSIAIQK